MKINKIPLVHPGEILMEEFLTPMGISQYRLSRDISVPPRRINEIVHGTRSVTADTALRLGRYFGVSPQFWLNLQSHFDLEKERDRLGDRLEQEVQTSDMLEAMAEARSTAADPSAKRYDDVDNLFKDALK